MSHHFRPSSQSFLPVTQEQDLLLCSVMPRPEKRLDSLLSNGGLDWTELFRMGLAHGVSGLLCDTLVKAAPASIPSEIRDACVHHLQELDTRGGAAGRQLLNVLDHLSTNGIDAIAFKGPVLALSAYGRLGLRSSRDLDFLVRHDQVRHCIAALHTLGYRHDRELTPRQWHAFFSYAGEEILFGPGLPIEPHWHFAPRTLALDLDYDALWSRTTSRELLGRRILSLSLEDDLVAICLHGSKEKWTKLKWVADVAAFVTSHASVEWELLVARCRVQGVGRAVRLGLGMARNLLAMQLPTTVSDWIDRDPQAVRLCQQLSDTLFVPKPERSIYQLSHLHWQMRERATDRWRYLLRTLSQPRTKHFNDIAIPDRLFGLYVPYKLIHDYAALPLWRGYKSLCGKAVGRARSEQVDAAG